MWTLKEQDLQAEAGSGNFALLGKSVNFKGSINFHGTMQIDGRVEGEVHVTGTLIVGEHAVITGILSANVLMNSGTISGTISATEKIQILKPGLLIGEIRTPVIAIEEGSQLQGTCDMGIQPANDGRALPVGLPHGLSAAAPSLSARSL